MGARRARGQRACLCMGQRSALSRAGQLRQRKHRPRHSVGLFPQGSTPEDLIVDLTGNVWEWVSDWYGEGYYQECPKENPKGSDAGEYKVLRGGSWVDVSTDLRAANRYGERPGDRVDDVGFRCAREVFP